MWCADCGGKCASYSYSNASLRRCWNSLRGCTNQVPYLVVDSVLFSYWNYSIGCFTLLFTAAFCESLVILRVENRSYYWCMCLVASSQQFWCWVQWCLTLADQVGVIGNLVHSSVNIKKEVLAAGALQPVIGLLRFWRNLLVFYVRMLPN